MGFPPLYPGHPPISERKGVKMMKKKILIRSIIGFLLGMVLGNLIMIFLSGGTFPWAPDTLILRFGSIQKVMILQTLFSGLMGAIAMGGSVVYEMDDWSLFSVTGIHYLLTMGSFLVISSVMDWCSDAKTYLVIIVLMTVAYVLVWLIMYVIYSRQVQELNELLEQKKRNDQQRDVE